MIRCSRWVIVSLVIGLVALWRVASVSALEAQASVNVTADIPLRVELAMIRDGNSVDRGSVDTILFDRFDDQDGPVPDPNPLFMYAPYRSEGGNNWHLASIIANGTSMTLTADVEGNAGPIPLADIMDVFTGGFFEPFDPPNFKGGASLDWELLDTFERSFDEPLTATTPLNYRLRLRGVQFGTHSGTVTYTLVSD